MVASAQSTARQIRENADQLVKQSLQLQWERWPHLQDSFSD